MTTTSSTCWVLRALRLSEHASGRVSKLHPRVTQRLLSRPFSICTRDHASLQTVKTRSMLNEVQLTASRPAVEERAAAQTREVEEEYPMIPSYAENPNWILPIPERRGRQLVSKRTGKKIKVLLPPRSARKHCPEPVKAVNASEITRLDPTGARTRLFALDNPDAIQVRDVVLVRQKTGDPFAGVVMRIMRKGASSGILVRNTVVGTGVEMDFKLYSPNVTGIELVQRRPRKPKQHRLYYLRDPKHDVGSVDNIVRQYLRSKMTVGAGKTVLTTGARPSTKPQKKRR